MNPVYLLIGTVCYLYFFWVFCSVAVWLNGYWSYLPPFVQPFFHKHSLDTPAPGLIPATSFLHTALTNAGLLGAFAVQHMIMARHRFKSLVPYPAEIERSIFVLAASGLLHLMLLHWQPMPENYFTLPFAVSTAVNLGGWTIVFLSTFMIDHFHLFGLKQSAGINPALHFVKFMFYRLVRHPLMTGFFIAFAGAEHFTLGRIMFIALTYGFILVDVPLLEEPDLITAVGPQYSQYMRTTPRFLPSLCPAAPRKPKPN